jgi:hypothetical protein
VNELELLARNLVGAGAWWHTTQLVGHHTVQNGARARCECGWTLGETDPAGMGRLGLLVLAGVGEVIAAALGAS